MPFDVFMDAALYDEQHGFYTAGGGSAGRRGDFVTSPEVGPLFGAVVARWLDRHWDALGRLDPFVVADVGAGPGTLIRSILAAAPSCQAALQPILVERSPVGRSAHHGLIDAAAGGGARSIESLEAWSGPLHAVIANELLDNLPVRLLERRDGRWWEVWVGPAGEELHPIDGAAVPARTIPTHTVPTGMDAIAGDVAEPFTIPVCAAAAAWVEAVRRRLEPGGRLLVFDYGEDTAALAARRDRSWLRTYRAQQRGSSPLDDPGSQDITCEVAFDQLPAADRREPQRRWLTRHGIDALVEEGRAIWTERAAIGDLAAWRARSRIREADALLDPSGLGAFVALEWSVTR